jgi:hypothetical protein
MSTSNPPVYDGPFPGEESEEKVEQGPIGDVVGSLTTFDRSLIDGQIATAKQYPRNITTALREAITLATLDEETAKSMLYALKRGNKLIPGPSVRLAEILAYSWTNLRVETDIVGEDAKTVTGMGTCFDLEKNVAVRVRTKRRITDKNGHRYNDDMIVVTGNAASSIAFRNAVFRVVPRAYVDKVYAAAKTASLGKGGTMTEKRQAVIDWFSKLAVKPEELFALLEIRGIDDIGEDELIQLRGLANAIKEGEQSVETVFRSHHVKSDGTTELNAALKKDRTPAPPKPAAAEPTTATAPAAPTPAATSNDDTSDDSDDALLRDDLELLRGEASTTTSTNPNTTTNRRKS